MLTWKYASRHNGVHLFDISTSKSAPIQVCFAHFDLEMCFAPQRHAVFHLSSGQMAPNPPTLRPPEATHHWKNTVFCDFPTFLRTCIFFLLTLSLLWSSLFFSSPLWLFPPLLFHLSILSEVWLLDFLRTYFIVIIPYLFGRNHPHEAKISKLVSCCHNQPGTWYYMIHGLTRVWLRIVAAKIPSINAFPCSKQ